MSLLQPENVQSWFPSGLQKRYVNHILKQAEGQSEGCIKLTHTQTEHLVRLWGYAYIKHYGADHIPIKVLICQIDDFCCSHSEAARLFYSNREVEGSARSAGLMLRKLESLRLIQCKSVKGSYTKISLNLPRTFELPEKIENQKLFPDRFDPRRDAPTVANFLKPALLYDLELLKLLGRSITNNLRHWSKQYPDGLRVLRQAETQKPVAIVSIFPVHPDAESTFDTSPSVHLQKNLKDKKEQIQVAEPSISGCCIAYMSCWYIKRGFWSCETVCQLQNEAKNILKQMSKTYPDLSDLYSILVNPYHEDLTSKVGFEIMHSDTDVFQHWIYIAIDDFLSANNEELFKDYDFDRSNH